MGYLDNTTITVDAILTKKGREKLAKGQDLGISKFALGDDEIDYTLWNNEHALGSNYYGVKIENLPLVEAIPDENQALKYKLISLPKGTKKIPVVTGVDSTVELQIGGGTDGYSPEKTITPTTNFGSNSNPRYKFTLYNGSIATVSGKTTTLDGESFSVIGSTFTITAKSQTETVYSEYSVEDLSNGGVPAFGTLTVYADITT